MEAAHRQQGEELRERTAVNRVDPLWSLIRQWKSTELPVVPMGLDQFVCNSPPGVRTSRSGIGNFFLMKARTVRCRRMSMMVSIPIERSHRNRSATGRGLVRNRGG